VLKAYFDRSGKPEDPHSRCVTLAGFAAQEDCWSYFDSEWKDILADRGGASFMHMTAAIQHEHPFEGWDAGKTNFLIGGLIGLLREANASKRFCGFRVTVDAAAHAKHKAVNNIPPIAQLCANLCFARVLTWYGEFPEHIISAFDLFFDRGDPFLHVLMQQWKNRKIVQEFPWWDLVRRIAPVKMEDTPAVQAADMLAWSHNRLKTIGPSGWAGWLATEIADSVECWNCDLDADALSSRKFPNAYGFYT